MRALSGVVRCNQPDIGARLYLALRHAFSIARAIRRLTTKI